MIFKLLDLTAARLTLGFIEEEVCNRTYAEAHSVVARNEKWHYTEIR